MMLQLQYPTDPEKVTEVMTAKHPTLAKPFLQFNLKHIEKNTKKLLAAKTDRGDIVNDTSPTNSSTADVVVAPVEANVLHEQKVGDADVSTNHKTVTTPTTPDVMPTPSGNMPHIDGSARGAQAGSVAMSLLGVQNVMKRISEGEKVETTDILTAGLGATDGVSGAFNVGIDDLAIAASRGNKVVNRIGKFGLIGTVVTSAPNLYKAHTTGDAGDKGAAWGELAGGVAVTGVGVVAGIGAAPLMVVAIPVVEGAQTVGRPMGKLFSDNTKIVAEGQTELAVIGERYSRSGTGQMDLGGQAVRSVGGAAKGLGDGLAWLGDQGELAYVGNGQLAAQATVMKVTGRTMQAVGYTLETAGHTISRTADEMGKAIRDEKVKEGDFKGTFTGIAKGVGVIADKAGPYVEKKYEEVKSAYKEYMPTWAGGDEPKAKEPIKTEKNPNAPKAAASQPLTPEQIDAQLTAKLSALQKGKWGGRIGNGDNTITLQELKETLTAHGVKLDALGRNPDGTIGNKALTDALYTIPHVGTTHAKVKTER